tara:strand:+ start:486 stop:860 length:375 start_codon:yes stop_codon:yes gene_type:complete
VTTRTSKAGIIAALKEVGIPIPEEDKIDALRHRLRNWRAGPGWIIRLIRQPSLKPHTPITLFEKGKTYWIPNSRMASDVVKTQLVFVMGRTPKPPKDAIVMDVPSDYNKRWPLGWDGAEHGSNE